MVVGDAPRGGTRMLSEEGFILVAVGGACVLLILGVLELLWPTKRRHVRQAAPAAVPPPPAAEPPEAELPKAAPPELEPPEFEPLKLEPSEVEPLLIGPIE